MHHVVPPVVGVGDGLAGERVRAEAHALGLHPFPHLLHQGLGAGQSPEPALPGVHAGSVALMLDAVEFLYLLQEP